MCIIPVLGYLFYLPSSALHPVFRHTIILFPVHVFTSMLPLFFPQRIQTPTFRVVYSACNLGLYSTFFSSGSKTTNEGDTDGEDINSVSVGLRKKIGMLSLSCF